MTLNEMYRYAKQHIDGLVNRWDCDLCAEYKAKGQKDLARAMLWDWRKKQSDLIDFKRNRFKESP